jgi:hypothetical protein
MPLKNTTPFGCPFVYMSISEAHTLGVVEQAGRQAGKESGGGSMRGERCGAAHLRAPARLLVVLLSLRGKGVAVVGRGSVAASRAQLARHSLAAHAPVGR